MKRSRNNLHFTVGIAGAVIVVLAAAAAGYYLAGYFQTGVAVPPVEADTAASLKVSIDQLFPNVTVLDTLFTAHGTGELLNPQGTIVIFTDNDCEPCSEVSAHFNDLIESNALKPEQVFGITFDDAGSLQDYLRTFNNRFESYSDEGFAFINQFGVSAFPLIFIVGRDGRIKEIYDDARFKPDQRFVQTAFGR